MISNGSDTDRRHEQVCMQLLEVSSSELSSLWFLRCYTATLGVEDTAFEHGRNW